MWEFFGKALSALPSAASSDLALAAYAITIAAYTLTVWRVTRNKNLLENLKRLPEKDRLSALEIEMGGVRLATGISPEQWVRSRAHRYYLMSFIIGCATVLTIFGVAIWRSSGTTDVSVDLYKSSELNGPATVAPRQPQRSTMVWPSIVNVARAEESTFVIPKPNAGRPSGLGADFDAFVAARNAGDREKTLEYRYQKDGNKITIEPHLEFADKQRRGEAVQGFDWWWQPFKWEFPILTVKIVNNSNKNVLLTEASFQIDKSQIDLRPIIVVAGADL